VTEDGQVMKMPPGSPMPGPDLDNPGPIPTEKQRVSLPPYTVAPPDILYIDSSRLIPKPPYAIQPLEVLLVQVTNTLPSEPINGPFVVSPEGTINLGYSYGSVKVQGMTIDQIQAAIRQQVSGSLRNAQVSVALSAFRGMQQTRGEHLVRPDGTVNLGIYGNVYVAGMTLGQVKCVIEKQLSEYVLNPQIVVDVYSYNSKWYYVIYDGGGYGEQLFKLPVTGNETVLDAIANLQGLPPVSSLRRMWIARPGPCGHPCDQILMVDWRAITQGGSTCTNYQLFPGDRVYIAADCLIEADNWLAKILQPIERLLGITLLGTETVQSFQTNGNGSAFFVP
jgi:polysaccharide export outer membrane protein